MTVAVLGAIASFLLIPASLRAEVVESDPAQGFNRGIFWFNDKLDVYFLEPVATGWDFVVPDPVERAIGRFFVNLGTPAVAVNNLLQLKPVAAASDLGRFVTNTTVGVVGFFDPASSWGMEAHNEDFGQTLGRWGVPPGPYLVLPFAGPSNPRDTAGLVVDYALSVYPLFVNTFIVMGVGSVSVVNQRSGVLEVVQDAKATAIDYYVFVRSAYVQRRRALVDDLKDPSAEEEEDLYGDDLYEIDDDE